MNSINLTGRITKDPEIKYLQNGTANVAFNIAVDRGYTDKDGSKQADFIPCVAWRHSAEFISKYVKKGNLLEITGQLQSRSYQTQNGETRVVLEVMVNTVANLTPRDSNAQSKPQSQPQAQKPQPVQEDMFDIPDEDLPF